jgi:hypothetical protein
MPIPATPPSNADVLLSVPMWFQEETNWCWAACADMVVRYYNIGSVQQCQLANFVFQRTDCCVPGGFSPCNYTCQVPDVPAIYGHFYLLCTSNSGTMTLAELKREIDHARPVEIAWQWSYVLRGHVVLISGYYTDDKLRVHDPQVGIGSLSHAELVNAKGLGSWFWSFHGIGR